MFYIVKIIGNDIKVLKEFSSKEEALAAGEKMKDERPIHLMSGDVINKSRVILYESWL